MAWLEAVLVLPGSTRDQDWWDSNVLLDRNVAMELEADGERLDGQLALALLAGLVVIQGWWRWEE